MARKTERGRQKIEERLRRLRFNCLASAVLGIYRGFWKRTGWALSSRKLSLGPGAAATEKECVCAARGVWEAVRSLA